eukprot:CAMPEP_0119562860 /NCGR_PEP_ID=MMETSP1352-20130426/21765_1 /TAXON_ID=265584 /ORGANISM="Stauroneis constricta, Strain CCMP1120" /LENGTH=342 /DNA_ID=CAMNT_0007611355 /DNA_START=22 /DNA_END=1050 /DNA_ORIENTATION=+
MKLIGTRIIASGILIGSSIDAAHGFSVTSSVQSTHGLMTAHGRIIRAVGPLLESAVPVENDATIGAPDESDDTVNSQQQEEQDHQNDDISSMRLGEIQKELRDLNVSYKDCFDRESLTKRLVEARQNEIENPETQEQQASTAATSPSTDVVDGQSDAKPDDSTPKTTVELNGADLEENLAQLRSMRVRELREECAKRQIRWGNFVEKEELVQAIYSDMKAAAGFSVTGMIRPGQVGDLDGEQLEAELQSSDTPILLDVYATWCGPCQMMAPQLKMVAEELRDKVRVVKVDSDKHPDVAQKYRVGGLPTVLVLQDGREQNRVEGALMKDGLLGMVQPYLQSET